MGNTRAPLEGASAAASGSGLTEEEREAGRDMNCDDDTTTTTTHTPLQGVATELEDAPGVEPALRNRVKTPERQAAVTRSAEYNRDIDRSRRRIDIDGDAVADNDGATTCSMASDDEADQAMSSLDEIDRRILASVIMGADVTEVFSPEK